MTKGTYSFILFSLLSFSSLHHTFAQSDCKEPDYLNKIAGFNLVSCEYSEFNEYKFSYNDLKNNYKELIKSGTFYRLNYEKSETETRNVSGAQILQNYLNAVLKIKGENLSSAKNFFRFSNTGKVIYMLVDNAWDDSDMGYQVYIIEEAAMKQDIEISIADAIKRDGKAPLYGIFFDFDLATLKPESDPELKRLADYLNTNPAVNVFIVGHTDYTGDFNHNLDLSKSRAKAVRDHLINKFKVNPARLISEGVGPLCPVTSNDAETGRKLNRRVEVVLRK